MVYISYCILLINYVLGENYNTKAVSPPLMRFLRKKMCFHYFLYGPPLRGLGPLRSVFGFKHILCLWNTLIKMYDMFS